MLSRMAPLWRTSFLCMLFSGTILNCTAHSTDCHESDPSCNSLTLLAYVLPVINRYFVYFDVGSTTTEAHALNLFTGALSPVMGSPFASTVAGFPDPTGRFMFSATFTAAPNNIRSYTIDTYTGVLQPTSVPLASANNQPVYADFTPDGRFVYFMNNTSLDVSAFSIDRTTGNLTKISDYPTSCACANLAQLRVTPNGKFLYVIGNGGAQPISGFSINQIDGTLTFIANLNTGVALSDGILVDAGSQYLYAINNTGVVFGYSINASSGVLTALAGSPFAGTANNFRGAMHPTGRFIYTVSVAGAQLGKQDVGSGGTLSVASTLGFGTNLQYVTVDPTGSFGFINNGGTNNYYVFSINSVDGAPTLLAGNPFTASGNPGSFSVARTQSNR